jgi:UDP-glucuronate 4-epimerase
LHCEHWGQLYSKLHDIRFIALRFFSVWGPGQRPDLAMEAFRRRIEKGEPIIINGDGSQRRDLTHVFDVVRAVEMAIHWQGEGATALNIGTGKNHSVMDMAKAAAALHFSGSSFTDFTPAVTHEPPHPADLPETRASLINTRKTLHWEPGIFFPIGPVSPYKKV